MNFVTFVVDRRVWDPGVVRSCEEEEEGCFALLCLEAVAMAMAVAPPMATLQGGLAAASTGLPRSSYLGLQLAAGQSPAALLPFFASNYRSSNSSQLRFRCQASSSSTTLPQLNVDISGVCVCVSVSFALLLSFALSILILTYNAGKVGLHCCKWNSEVCNTSRASCENLQVHVLGQTRPNCSNLKGFISHN